MKINCRCGRVLKVTKELAGKKIKCKACGQKFRLPALKPADPTIQMKAWKDEDEKEDAAAKNPDEVGAVPLGEKLSIGFVLASVIITIVTTIAGIFLAKYLLTAMVTDDNVAKYADYIKLGMFWGPSLAFVVSGYVVARLSPGRTISEPAIGAAIAVAIFVSLLIAKPDAVSAVLAIKEDVNLLADGNLPLKLNLFGLGMFNAACLACAGAYFGEVAQEKKIAV